MDIFVLCDPNELRFQWCQRRRNRMVGGYVPGRQGLGQKVFGEPICVLAGWGERCCYTCRSVGHAWGWDVEGEEGGVRQRRVKIGFVCSGHGQVRQGLECRGTMEQSQAEGRREGEGERWILQRERYVAIGWLLVQKCNLNRFCKNLLTRPTKI